jgi:DNA replication licensing factor MCM4
MSSPPALDFPSSDMEDVVMNDGTQTQSMPEAPRRDPLFLAGTSSVIGTPVRQPYNQSSPLRGATARRALGMSTPKKTPLFARTISTWYLLPQLTRLLQQVLRLWLFHRPHL